MFLFVIVTVKINMIIVNFFNYYYYFIYLLILLIIKDVGISFTLESFPSLLEIAKVSSIFKEITGLFQSCLFSAKFLKRSFSLNVRNS